MEFHNIVIATFIIMLTYMYIENRNNDVSYEVSTFDNRKYLVRNLDDKQEAANLLAKIRKNLEDLCEDLKKVYPDHSGVGRLIEKFNPNSISETSKNSKYTSYSVNKGEKIVLCLRARDDTENLVDENTLMFVSIHEIAHIMTKSVGHKQEFWKNFKFLLKHAISIGLYKHEDYNNNPKKYCGIMITDTPLNDNSL
jgi:predicted metal-dependent hydrolase